MGDVAERDDDPTPAALGAGTRVEVRRRLDGQWARGFEISEPVDEGYRVRRLSDGQDLPIVIPVDDVRKERKKSGWWY